MRVYFRHVNMIETENQNVGQVAENSMIGKKLVWAGVSGLTGVVFGVLALAADGVGAQVLRDPSACPSDILMSYISFPVLSASSLASFFGSATLILSAGIETYSEIKYHLSGSGNKEAK